MHVAIAGSSGLIGTALQDRLRRDGHEVSRLVRSSTNDAARAGEGRISWDPTAGRLDPDALAPVDAVVNLAGESIGSGPWTGTRRRRLRDSRILGTRLLAATLAGLAERGEGPRVLVNASAIGYYGDRGDEPLTERTDPGHDFLADLCVDWEAATGAAADAGVRVVRLRTGIVLAPHGGALAKQVPLFRLGLGGPAGSGRQWMSWISLDDEVSVIERALEDPALSGPVNATAPEPVTNLEFTKALGAALHRPTVLRVPRLVARLPFGVGPLLDSLLFSSARVEPAALRSAGFTFAHPRLDDALAAALAR